MSTETNKAAVRRYIEEIINGDNAALIDELFAPHLAERVKAFRAESDRPFPDGREEIQDIVAEGEKVMVRLLFRGTHEREFMGLAPTGKRIEIAGYATYYFENGLITWDTFLLDWLDAMEQLGATF